MRRLPFDPRSRQAAFPQAGAAVDADGTEVTVMSALARRGYDPWREAERLARLPAGSAVRELADAIAVRRGAPSETIDVVALALLEPPGRRPIARRTAQSGAAAAALRMRSICLVVFLLLASAFVFRLLMRSAGRIEGMPALTDKMDLRVQPPDRRP